MFYDEKPDLDELMHYGTPRHSGRYPWGSGEDPYQHTTDFLSRVKELKDKGLSEPEIAKVLNILNEKKKPSTTMLRVQISLANDQRKTILADRARSLREDGKSLNEIAKIMGFNNDSSVRSLLNVNTQARRNAAMNTADFLRKKVDEKGMIDVGKGTELSLNISKEKLKEALYILKLEGYPTYGGGIPTGPNKQTNMQVLCKPGTEHKAIYDYKNVHSLDDYISYDDGESFKKAFEYPSSLSFKRLQIKYAEEGGVDKDGVIEIRRGVPDLDLGGSHYAQVRIMVDGTHYLKGMAVYADDLPDGVDVRFNTNKTKGTPVEKVLKEVKKDKEGNPDRDNPFGSLIKEHGGQSYYDDPKGKYVDPVTGKKQSLSLINKRSDEGDWDRWANKIPSQFLAKQNISLIKRQLGLTKADKQAEFDEICELTNPTVKRRLLQSFADDCDAAAVHLKAAALPRQRYQVILPLTTIGDNQVYAPNYKDGEKVALVRYPHAGTFEIPILTVNNKIAEGKRVIGTNPFDAVGISKNVADRLSGADFDGDTVMVIPTGRSVKITSTRALDKLQGFDPKMEYPERKGMAYMSKDNLQKQMGIISNLITDMTLKGATEDKLARAVKHSMVVIDSYKHKLDYKRSEEENGIAALKKEYQGHIGEDGRYHEGASTLISRSKSSTQVLKRRGTPYVNQEGKPWYDPSKPEGGLIYKSVKETYVDKKGKTQMRMQNSTKMAEASDAYSLVSDANTAQERAYADYANYMKALANKARKEMVTTPRLQRNPSAAITYKEEASSLKSKLNIAEKNAPKERKARLIANAEVKAKKEADPDLTKEDIKKIEQQALSKARIAVGSKRQPVEITDKEWEAIQAGAVSDNTLSRILNNTDIDKLRERATPRAKTAISQSMISRIRAYKASGCTTSEIAEALNISNSTVMKYLK